MKMNIDEYRLPEITTPENLEMYWSNVLNFGHKVIMAGHYYYKGKDYWFGAVYEFTTDDDSCEGEIELKNASETLFEDNGHAIEWAMKH